VERDAKYATVALFALACIATAVAFIWWYSGRGDRRDYDRFEIYFQGTVSGLSKGSPVRYLGVDVGRVTSLAVDKTDPSRVKILADIDSTAPISSATLARLGLLGLTGLLYIDLQQDPETPTGRPLPQGERYPVITARKGTIEASMEQLPLILSQTSEVMGRIEQLLADKNVQAVSATLANVERMSRDLPATVAEARALTADLRRVSESTLALTTRIDATVARAGPGLEQTLGNVRAATEKLSATADSLDRIINANDGAFGRVAGSSLGELQQLVIDARTASDEVRALASELRGNPSGLLRERPESGVEIPR
jgi:phospholipid/cholesterol/gamma-HCH transport system substrate-binding protein